MQKNKSEKENDGIQESLVYGAALQDGDGAELRRAGGGLRRRPGRARVFWSLAVLVLASLADMASEFVFDKYEYAPWLYLSMPLAAAATAGLLWVWKGKRGILPAALLLGVTALLLLPQTALKTL